MNWAEVLSSVDFQTLATSWTTAIPVVVAPLSVAYGVKAGWRFVRKSLRGVAKG